MKKLLFVLMLLLSGITAMADNEPCFIMGENDNSYFLRDVINTDTMSYFTMGVNDSILINPILLGSIAEVPVRAHFWHRFDSWTIKFMLPVGLSTYQVVPDTLPGGNMRIPYVNSSGVEDVYKAILTYDNDSNVYSCTNLELGYWDPNGDGLYESYGTVKWEPGNYEPMMKLRLDVNSSFRSGVISILGEIISTNDDRGNTGFSRYNNTFTVIVGYRKGDVNGDGLIDSDDVVMLMSFVMQNKEPNEFQFAAGDMNSDNNLDVNDVTLLINWVLNH